MKKQLDVATITNELRGNSAFFPHHRASHRARPSAEPAVEQSSPPPVPARPPSPHPVPPGRVVPPVPLVPPVREVPPPKRVMKQRWPVDIYVDRYESLQELALEERKQGGIGSMSAMVREALDQLIAKRRSTKK